jgi:hypothetical protein
MVLPASDRYPPTFVVYDPKGTPLGRVRNPVGRRVVGLGEGAVYLERPMPRFSSGSRWSRVRARRHPSWV